MIKCRMFCLSASVVLITTYLSGRLGLDCAWAQSFEQTVAATPGGEMNLDLLSGGAVEIHGWDENSVTLRVHQCDERKTQVTLERTSGGVVLRAQPASGKRALVNCRFDVWVPRQYNLSIDSAGGELLMSDMEGNFRGKTRGGRIFISRSRGYAELFTGGGEVRVADSELSGSVTTAKGIAELSNVHGDVQVSSSSRN